MLPYKAVYITGCGHSASRPGHHTSGVSRTIAHWIQPCFLSFALPRERYPPGRHWRAGPYLYGSNASS